MKTTFTTSCIVLIVFIFACKKTETPATIDCTGSTPTYTADLKSILDARCATSGCHDAVSKEDNKDFSNYAAAKSAATGNDFTGSIQHLSGYAAMPQGASKLSEAEIKTLTCWAQNGMAQ